MDETTNLLRQIAAQTKPTITQSFVLTSPPGNRTDAFDIDFPRRIAARSGRVLEMALNGLRTFYSRPNIEVTNNSFVYSVDSGATWRTIQLPTGAYELESINTTIQLALKQANHWDTEKAVHYISIDPNLATLRAVIEITHPTYQVDIGKSTLRTVLGWPAGATVLTQGRHEAPNIVQINSVSEVVIHCDAIDGTYTKPANSKSAQQGFVLASFFPSVAPGYKISYTPRHLNWLRVTRTEIANLRFWITDQDDRPIDLRGEPLTISCLIRDVVGDLLE